MLSLFVQYLFTGSVLLSSGAARDIPIMTRASPEVAGIVQLVATSRPVPCDPARYACPVGPVPTLSFQLFCTEPGAYTFTLRAHLIAQEATGGKFWLEGPQGQRALLAAFNAAPGAPAYVGASLQVQSLTYESCYSIKYDANHPIELDADPPVSFLTITR